MWEGGQRGNESIWIWITHIEIDQKAGKRIENRPISKTVAGANEIENEGNWKRVWYTLRKILQ